VIPQKSSQVDVYSKVFTTRKIMYNSPSHNTAHQQHIFQSPTPKKIPPASIPPRRYFKTGDTGVPLALLLVETAELELEVAVESPVPVEELPVANDEPEVEE
jgi:hypothetical protein